MRTSADEERSPKYSHIERERRFLVDADNVPSLDVEAAAVGRMPDHAVYAFLAQHGVTDPTGRRPFGLFAQDGRWIGGNLLRLPRPLPEFERFFETSVQSAREHTIYRSFLHRLPDGRLIVISRNIEELQRFRNELLESTLLGLALMLALGAVGSLVIARGSLRWLDNVTRAIEGITRGDLSGRLPRRGNNDEIDRLARIVNTMLDQIERLMGEVKGVCDSIAHDLRTPLTRLLGALERANRQSLDEETRRVEISGAIMEVQLMLRTFAALLRISEVEDGVRRASFRNVDLRALVTDAIDYYAPAAEEKLIDLAAHDPAEVEVPITIEGDADLLFEAFGNLIDNAIKFTAQGGHITVALAPGPIIDVRDDGCGVPRHDYENVKLRFHRGSRSHGQPGSGLGLPLVGAIARLHGLEIGFVDTRVGCWVRLSPIPSTPKTRAED